MIVRQCPVCGRSRPLGYPCACAYDPPDRHIELRQIVMDPRSTKSRLRAALLEALLLLDRASHRPEVVS